MSRKFCTMLFLCFMTVIAANAQVIGRWENVELEGDELKGRNACLLKTFTNKNGDCFVYNKTNKYIYGITRDGIFDYEYDDWADKIPQNVLVGLYDINDNLVERIKGENFSVSDDARTIHCYSDKINKKVTEYLENQVGYVRVVADKYMKYDFDIKVPCFKNKK